MANQEEWLLLGGRGMQVKVYVPKTVEIPSEYIAALAQRASDSFGSKAGDVFATRGHLVRQAARDGLLREFDELINEDGTVDVFCDPNDETPLEVENRAVSLVDLVHALSAKRGAAAVKSSAFAA